VSPRIVKWVPRSGGARRGETDRGGGIASHTPVTSIKRAKMKGKNWDGGKSWPRSLENLSRHREMVKKESQSDYRE